MIRVGLVGFGYWGPNLARNVAESPTLDLVAVIDGDDDRRRAAHRRYPDARVSGSVDALTRLARHDDVDALVIATPPETHYPIAVQALNAGWHVLVAKPLATRVQHAEELVRLAKERQLLLMTDHTFVYTGAVRAMQDVARAGRLGRPLYYDSVRVNLGIFQRDCNVIWDLAPHDLALLHTVLPDEKPVAVQAVGAIRAGGPFVDVAWLTVWHASGFVAHMHLSWLSPVKVRRALLAGDRRMIVYDDMEPSEKIRVYDSGATFRPGPDAHAALVDYRTGDCWAPHLDFTEALAVELHRFSSAITDGRHGFWQEGLDVVRVLAAADRSLAEDGRRVQVS